MAFETAEIEEGPSPSAPPTAAPPDSEAVIHVGWGRLIFAQTFDAVSAVTDLLLQEESGERDMAVYVEQPQIALAQAPQDIFLDPSHMYRLPLSAYEPVGEQPRGFTLRRLRSSDDAKATNAIYARVGMVGVPNEFLMNNRKSRRLTYLVAEDEGSGDVIATVTGVDHVHAFNDPESGCSLWCLAVDPQCALPGVGEAMVRALIEHYRDRGRAQMDLSVMHDNHPAKKLYERLGFEEVGVFTLKRKNPVNEKLFMGPPPEARLNPYARIIVNEARRRGIAIQIEDEEGGFFALSFGGRTIHCRESLSDLTTAVAMSRCDDKAVTHRLLAAQDLKVPEQRDAGEAEDNARFLARHGALVVKPARGEQGVGISVDVRDQDGLERAITVARSFSDRVLLEQYCPGLDLRIIVIDYAVVAAAVRRPAAITGNGRDRIADLIHVQSRRRKAATGGESRIPIDAETERCVALAGYGLEDILPEGEYLEVRRTANLHTGGTIHDVTDDLHESLREAACQAARVLQMPVVGFDFLVPAVDGQDYVIVEANERPGLANHEPQPTAQRFIDLLFPQTVSEQS